jgi:hypothetical protein
MKKINQLKTALIMLFLVLGITLNAQDKEAKDKLADLKGNVEKVTIKVDGKDVVFEGKEAERIASLAKATGEAKLVQGFKLDESALSSAKKHVRIFKNGGDKQFTVISSDDLDMKAGENEKKVKVEIKDGKKNITVTTKKDGKEETKTYEGEEAEKFLSTEGGDGRVKVIMKKVGDDECESEDDENVIVFNKKIDSGGCNCCCKSSCKSGGMNHIKMMHGGKGKMMWKMMDDDSDEKEVHVIVEKKVDKKKELKETKETKKEEKK